MYIQFAEMRHVKPEIDNQTLHREKPSMERQQNKDCEVEQIMKILKETRLFLKNINIMDC